MIDNTNRMEVALEAVKRIYIARMMMRMVCHSTGCSGCPFHNPNLPSGTRCFYARVDGIMERFPQFDDMLFELNNQPKHSKPIKEAGND